MARATLSMASAVVRCPFSRRFWASQADRAPSASPAVCSPNTWGWRKISFRQIPSTTSSKVNRPSSRAICA